jgi:hypothetical protein
MLDHGSPSRSTRNACGRRRCGEALLFPRIGDLEVPKPAELAERGGVWFEADAVKIHLGVEQDFRPARKAQPGLLVRDLQALSKGLAGAGHEMTNGEPLDGYQHIYPNDPFGNRLELLEASGLSNT